MTALYDILLESVLHSCSSSQILSSRRNTLFETAIRHQPLGSPISTPSFRRRRTAAIPVEYPQLPAWRYPPDPERSPLHPLPGRRRCQISPPPARHFRFFFTPGTRTVRSLPQDKQTTTLSGKVIGVRRGINEKMRM